MPKIVKNKAFQAISVFSVTILVVTITMLGLFFSPKIGQTQEQSSPTFSGVKFNDVDRDGMKDSNEPLLNGWEICIEYTISSYDTNTNQQVDEDKKKCVFTGDGSWSNGYYELIPDSGYNWDEVTITEKLVNGWVQTAPTGGSHVVYGEECDRVPNTFQSICLDLDFGNYEKTFCGDEEVQAPNDDQFNEECDGTKGITGNQTCSDTCTIVEPEPESRPEPVPPPIDQPEIIPDPVELFPELTVVKSAESGDYYPGDSINYIVTIKNVGDKVARNIRIADTMPTGFTYEDDSGGSWFFGNLGINKEMNHIYSVTVATDVAPGKYINTVQVSADNHDAIEAKASVEILEKPGVVLGAATSAPEELPAAGLPMGLLAAITIAATAGASIYRFRK